MSRFAVAAFFLFMLQLGFEHAEGQNRLKVPEHKTDCAVTDSQSELGFQKPESSTSSFDKSCKE